MTFAGLSNPQDRANVMAFLNSRDNAPLPVPAAPAEQTADADASKPGTGPEQPGPQRAEKETGTKPVGGGEAAPGAGPGNH
jgi:cytochrome c